jgi:hypothetical protein
MKYIVSPHGLGVAIGIVGDKEQALYDAQLAENLYGVNHSDALFDRLVFMDSWKQFRKFLILKEYFKIRSDLRNSGVLFSSEIRSTKHAITLTRKTIKENVSFENFMWQVAAARSNVHECNIELNPQ